MKFKKVIISLAAVAGLIFAGMTVVRSYFPLKYQSTIESCAREYSMEKELLQGVIFAESKFLEDAHSGKAAGLMQITEETASWICRELDMEYSEEMLYIPETNIEMGSFYLAYLAEKYKNMDTALAAYNAGMGNVAKWLKDKRYSPDGITLSDIPFGETKRYVQRVNRLKKLYEIIY